MPPHRKELSPRRRVSDHVCLWVGVVAPRGEDAPGREDDPEPCGVGGGDPSIQPVEAGLVEVGRIGRPALVTRPCARLEGVVRIHPRDGHYASDVRVWRLDRGNLPD